MKYTKEEQLEMLKEMWNEANKEFTKQMANKQLTEAWTTQKKLDLITALINCFEI